MEIKSPLPTSPFRGGHQSTMPTYLKYKKIRSDTWAGTGANPAFLSTWKLKNYYSSYVCTLENSADFSEDTFTESAAITLQQGTYTVVQENFGFGQTSCTGNESGTTGMNGTITITNASSGNTRSRSCGRWLAEVPRGAFR